MGTNFLQTHFSTLLIALFKKIFLASVKHYLFSGGRQTDEKR